MSEAERPWWRRSPDDLVAEARAAYKKGNLGAMFRRCVQALWLNPDHPTARRGVATFFVREGKYPLAVLYDPAHPAIPRRIPRPRFGAEWVSQSVARYIGAAPGDFTALAKRKRTACTWPPSPGRRPRQVYMPLIMDDEGLLWLEDVMPLADPSSLTVA